MLPNYKDKHVTCKLLASVRIVRLSLIWKDMLATHNYVKHAFWNCSDTSLEIVSVLTRTFRVARAETL